MTLRVLICHQEPSDPELGQQGAGGAEVYVRRMATFLEREGHEVRLAFRAAEALEGLDWSPDIVHLSSVVQFWRAEDIERILDLSRCVVWTINDYWPVCGWRMALTSTMKQCPLVLEGKCAPGPCGFPGAPPHYRQWLSRARAVATHSAGAAILLTGAGVQVTHVVELGLDPEAFAPPPGTARDPLPDGDVPPHNCLVLATCAWPAPWKGLDTLGAAIRSTGLRCVVVHGRPRAEVAAWLRRASIYAFPSLYPETFGLGLLEAMASGCACVASDVAGARSMIDDGTGIVVPPGDAGALAEAIIRLRDDPILRRHLGAAAVSRVRSRFTEAHWTDRTLAMYRDALDGETG